MVNEIFIRGIDKRATIRSSVDGLCKSIINLRAKGTADAPKWEPIKQAEPLTIADTTAKGYVELFLTTSGSGGTTAEATITFGAFTVVVSDYSSPTFLPSFTIAISDALNANADFAANFESSYTTFSSSETLIRIQTKVGTSSFNGYEFRFQCDNAIYNFNGVKSDTTVRIERGLSAPVNPPIYSFWQNRTVYGDFTENESANLNRLVLVYEDRIALMDEDTANSFVPSVAPYSIDLNGLSITNHSTLDEINLITLLSNGKPEKTLVLVDDAIFPLEFPDLPYISITHKEDSSESFLSEGQYGFFFAYEMQDGSTFMPSPVIPVHVYNDVGHSTKLEVLNQGIEIINNSYFFWRKLIRTLSLFMCVKSEGVNDIYSNVYYKVGELGIDVGAKTTLELTNDSIPTGLTYEIDVINANHKLLGYVSGSYNKRFLLGGISFDFAAARWRNPHVTAMPRDYVPAIPPASFPYINSPDTTASSYNYKLIVELQTESGTFYRESAIHTTNKLYPEFEYGYFHYPDRRAKTLAIIWEETPGVWTLRYQFELTASKTLNAAYKYLPSAYTTDSFYQIYIDANVDTNAKSFESRKLAMSDSLNPYIFKGANVYRVGQYSDEQIQGFGANSLPISTGQYGEFPLYVFTNKSIWALAQSADSSVAFSSIHPVSLTDGALNTKAITNFGQSVLFVSQEGVFSLSEGRTELISRPINDVVDWEAQANQVAISQVIDGTSNEIWVCLPTITYVFNPSRNAWYSFSRTRKQLFSGLASTMYGLGTDGNLYNEKGIGYEDYSLETNPIHLGSIDVPKRLKSTFIRASIHTPDVALKYVTSNRTYEEVLAYEGSALTIRTNYGSAFGFILIISSTEAHETDSIDMIQMEYENRYLHRIRS